MESLLDFLDALENRNIFYKLSAPTVRAVMVEIAVPGERWEVEYFEDGHVAIEVFVSRAGVSVDDSLISELFRRFSD